MNYTIGLNEIFELIVKSNTINSAIKIIRKKFKELFGKSEVDMDNLESFVKELYEKINYYDSLSDDERMLRIKQDYTRIILTDPDQRTALEKYLWQYPELFKK